MPPLTSLAKAVIPTAVPLAAPSATVPPVAPSLSVGVAGATSLTAMVKVWSWSAVPSEAWTVMLWLVARLVVEQRAVGDGDHAVLALIAKRPPASSVRL